MPPLRGEDRIQLAQLSQADGRLQLADPVVSAQDRVVLEPPVGPDVVVTVVRVLLRSVIQRRIAANAPAGLFASAAA